MKYKAAKYLILATDKEGGVSYYNHEGTTRYSYKMRNKLIKKLRKSGLSDLYTFRWKIISPSTLTK